MEQKAADAILQTPLKFSVKNRGLLRFIVKKISLSVTPFYPGTIIKMSRELKKLKIDVENIQKNTLNGALANYEENSWVLARAIAIGIINTKPEKVLLTGLLTRYLHRNLNHSELKELSIIIVSQINITDFTLTIVFLNGLNMLAPKKTGTSQTITGETIAPGDLSED